MTVLFSPFGNSQYLDNNGAPAVGYTVESYAAGSSTALATYTDSTGATPNAASVTLNAAGLNPAGQFWLTSGLAYKFIVKDADGATVQTVNGVTGVNDPAVISTADQWLAYAGTPTYISATSFSVVGDQTSTYQIGRRVKTTNTAGTIHSTITNSSFGAGITTVTVANDSGTLDSGLSAVSCGLISATSSSLPAQAWSNVAASRAINTQYTNTTGRTITALASVAGAVNNSTLSLSWTVAGVAGMGSQSQIAPSTAANLVFATSIEVPPGATYQLSVTQGTLSAWHELR
jgi:hypothetical protein